MGPAKRTLTIFYSENDTNCYFTRTVYEAYSIDRLLASSSDVENTTSVHRIKHILKLQPSTLIKKSIILHLGGTVSK